MRGARIVVGLVRGMGHVAYGVGYAAGYSRQVAADVAASPAGEHIKLSAQLGWYRARNDRRGIPAGKPADEQPPVRVKREGNTLVVDCDIAV